MPSERASAFLAGKAAQSRPRGNLIFALDATASREPTWDLASQLTAEMFKETASVGELDVQLTFFRGAVGECKSSAWVRDPLLLTKLMSRIRCESGTTQITKVLQHALRQSSQRKIGAMVFIGDASEEPLDRLVGPARELGGLGVPVFTFLEGHDQVARSHFQEIAKLTHGGFHAFDQGSAQLLSELLKAVAAFAIGGILALEKQDSAAARRLLGQIR